MLMKIYTTARRACATNARLEQHLNRVYLNKEYRSNNADGPDVPLRGSKGDAAIGGYEEKSNFFELNFVFY